MPYTSLQALEVTSPAFCSPDPVCKSPLRSQTLSKVMAKAEEISPARESRIGIQSSRARKVKVREASLPAREISLLHPSLRIGQTTGSRSSEASSCAADTAEVFVPIPTASSYMSVQSRAATRSAQPVSTAKPAPEAVLPLQVWQRRRTLLRGRQTRSPHRWPSP